MGSVLPPVHVSEDLSTEEVSQRSSDGSMPHDQPPVTLNSQKPARLGSICSLEIFPVSGLSGGHRVPVAISK